MAIGDPYASVAEYKARVDSSGSASDGDVAAQLQAICRYLDRRCGRFFGQDAAVQVRVYDGGDAILQRLDEHYIRWAMDARTRLYLPDDIATTTGLVVKVDLDNDHVYEQTLVINTDFWVGEPNAALGPEPQPYTWLQVVPSGSVLTTWPANERSVQVTAIFGWPQVPGPVREATVMLARELRDLQRSGYTLTLESIDAAVSVSPRGPAIIHDIVKNYGRQRRFFA